MRSYRACILLAPLLLAILLVPSGQVRSASSPVDASLVAGTSSGVLAIDHQGNTAAVLLYQVGVGMIEGTMPLAPTINLAVGRVVGTFYDERSPARRPAPATVDIPAPGIALLPTFISGFTVRVRYPGSAAEQTIGGEVGGAGTGGQVVLAGAVAMALHLHRWDWLYHLATKDVRAQYSAESLASELSSTLSGSRLIGNVRVSVTGAYSGYGLASCSAGPACGDSPVTINLGPGRSRFAGHVLAASQQGWRFVEALVAPGSYIPARAPIWFDVQLGPGTRTYRIDSREQLLTQRDGRTVRNEQTRRAGTVTLRFRQQPFGSNVSYGSPVATTLETTVTLNGASVPQPVPLDPTEVPAIAFAPDGRVIDFDSLGRWQPSGDNFPLQSYGIYSLAMFGPVTPRVVPVGSSWTADIQQDLAPLASRALALAITTPISPTLGARNTLLAPMVQSDERLAPIHGDASASLVGPIRLGNRTMRLTVTVTATLQSQYIIAVKGGFSPANRLGAAALNESIVLHFAPLAHTPGQDLRVIYARSVRVAGS